ncbi:hypothetical protein Pan189_17510 [Stratiformator vulcanicus]|uniref:Uncharacterized protein n=1 Tax=Stratiformator vulcanicus TaxID=2527980 RepID=A0A517R0F2_9PLAN|nr:hypothetical protein Pan189_17510 [Stratiformator vulcanicus]
MRQLIDLRVAPACVRFFNLNTILFLLTAES